MSKYLVTSALPYANGPIHFGHIAGAYLPADIFVRYRRAKGDAVLYICGSDEHGAPITANAAKAGESPADFTKRWHDWMVRFFDSLGIEFDNFSRTSLPHHHELSQDFFKNCLAKDRLSTKTTEQAYCVPCSMFLPDRYLVGTCPKCGHTEARGDECPKCGHWIQAGELGAPRCKLCGQPPETRETTHWFLHLDQMQPQLEEWLEPKRPEWKSNVLAQVDGWLKDRDADGTITGLKPRSITRDLDWGVKVPVDGPEAEGKVLYVWFDAPIGYISSTIEWAEKRGEPEAWKDWWLDQDTKLIHFVGKDNIVFHCLTWPAVLMCQDAGYVLPDNVPANEFYNLQGDKFNTTSGWYIDVEGFFEKYSTDVARYAIARSFPETADAEWRWEEFQSRGNAELNDTFGNLAQRTLKMVGQAFEGKWPEATGEWSEDEQALLDKLAAWPARLSDLLERYKARDAAQEWMELAREGNRYVTAAQPWKTRKTDLAACARTLVLSGRVLAALAVLGRPFVPTTCKDLWGQLGFDPASLAETRWDDAGTLELPVGQALGEVQPLFSKIPDADIQAELQALEERKAAMCADAAGESADAIEFPPLEETCEFPDFLKVDLRAGRVLEAEEMKKSKKLLKLQVDLGFEKRQILAGLKEFYSAEEMVGRRVVVVANLAPRKMMGEESQGMVLATTDAGSDRPVVVDPGEGVAPGSRVS